MKFDNILNLIPHLGQLPVSTAASHAKMEPTDRIEFMKTFDASIYSPRNAAVMALIYPKVGVAHLVLILRTSYNGVHSSQVAFPGGKAELFDGSFWDTAVRETNEEIGVVAAEMKFVRDLSPLYVPPSNFMVYPFLGYALQEPTFVLDATEVAGIIEIPISDFLNIIPVVSRDLETSYMQKKAVNGFEINQHFVWGATAMILSELKDLLKSATL